MDEKFDVVVVGASIAGCTAATLHRLGLDKEIEAAGGLNSSAVVWTTAGWIPWTLERGGYNIRREKLDALVRKLPPDTPGVTLMLGSSVTARPSGL